jgi:hypothetical protein
VTIHITLPSGDEEVIPRYRMCFTDKPSDVKLDTKEDDDVVDLSTVEFEFKIHKLINFIKK